MRRITVSLVVSVIGALLLGSVAMAQTQTAAPMGPPKVLSIFREEVKPGKGLAHEKHETAWTQALIRAKSPDHFLALSSISGPHEDWFITGYDSFAAFEKASKAEENSPAAMNVLQQYLPAESDYLSGARRSIATFREDLSYRPSVQIGRMRYFRIDTVRVRPGHEEEFVELRKIVNSAHEKANIDEHWAVFQVVSGAPSGTYLVFIPMRSLGEVDNAPAIHGQAYRDAMGDDGRKRLRELASSAIIVTESNTYAFSAKMSYVSDQTAAADPEFWRPKPKMDKTAAPAKAAPKKEEKKGR